MTLSTLFAATPLLATLSLQEMTCSLLQERLQHANPTNSLCRFADYAANAGRGQFVVNTNFYLKGVDFSCVSPWNSSAGRLKAGTAISRRHIIFAKHFAIGKGTRILFTDDEIGVCPCWMVDTREIPHTDIMIGLLDAELTPNIRPAKVLPVGFEKWMTPGSKWPVVTFNQHEQAFLTELTCQANAKSVSLYNRFPESPLWQNFGGRIVVGDSGDPAFLLIGNQPILLYCLKTGGPGNGPMIHQYRFQIQQAMNELCPGYTLDSFTFDSSNHRK